MFAIAIVHMTQELFDLLYGFDKLEVKDTNLEFAALVIGQLKESGGRLMEIKQVPENIKGSIDVLNFVRSTALQEVNLRNCKNITGIFEQSSFIVLVIAKYPML